MQSWSVLGVLFSAGVLLGPCAAPAIAGPETTLPVKSRSEAFANPTTQGSRQLKSVVWYPSAATGSRALAKGPAEGRSVIVFLHGRGGFAFVYGSLGRKLAQRGYVVVLSDTARTDPKLQRADGRALLAALQRANEQDGSFWKGALDLSRVGIAGHSMGGGSAAHILARNPGYRAGFAFAPWQGGRSFTDACTTLTAPFGMAHGEGDTTLPWRTTSKELFDAIPAGTEKFLYLMNRTVTHNNLAIRIPFAGKSSRDVFGATIDLCAAFFDSHLQGDDAELRRLLRSENQDPRLVRIYSADAEPGLR